MSKRKVLDSDVVDRQLRGADEEAMTAWFRTMLDDGLGLEAWWYLHDRLYSVKVAYGPA